jgi:hypothetical protein
MNRELLLEKLTELPEAAQQQVLDYIAFLHTRYGIKQNEPLAPAGDLSSEPFVGMWRDRLDMQDSTRWVRETRQNDW